MKAQCDICNRPIEEHLRARGKRLCFACLTEEAGEAGSVPTFNIKSKPIQAPCAVCEADSSSSDLVPSPWGFICQNCCAICETQTGISWDMVKIAAQKEWLVKANTKIMGPYTAEDIEQNLKDNLFVAHDEIIRPAGRWRLMRDEEQFRIVLNEVRNRRPQNQLTGEMTQSETLNADDAALASEIAFSPDRLIEGLKQTPNPPPLRPAPGVTRDLVKTYATRDDAKIRRELSSVRTRRMWFAFAFFLVAGLFLAHRITMPREDGLDSRSRDFQELMATGFKAEKVGDYQKALSQFSEARLIRPNDPELLLHLAPLSLVYDRQVLQAQRMFKEILDTEKSPNYQRASNIGLGLVALETHDWDVARDFFQKALSFDSEYLPAIANLGMVAFYKDDQQMAEGYLLRALEKGNSDGAMVMALTDVDLAQYFANPRDKTKLQNAHKMLQTFLELSRDYTQEILIKDSRVLSIMGKTTDAAKRIEAFLDIDPEQTELHVRDWTVYRGRTSWGLLLDDLRKVSADLASSPRLTAAMGLAQYRGREKLEGAQSIEQALSQATRDPLLQALAGWVELKLGRKDVAAVNIHEAAQAASNYKLPHILQARMCEQEHDFDCAKQQWNMVLKLDSRSIEALHGLASVAWQRDHDRQTVMTYLTQLYANDPYYIPYLRLMQDVADATAAAAALGPNGARGGH